MTFQNLLDSVMAIEREIEGTPVGSPELAAVIARIQELQSEVHRIRGLQGPLVPDAASPPGPEERSVAELDRALDSLMKAARSKQ